MLFGPHETNLGSRRSLSNPHVAYYARRARGGAGIVVTETASVHDSDWPYERAPLAADCAEGWRQIAEACHAHGALVLAGLGHTGLQGSSAFSQAALWGPSRFADVGSREVPMQMEQPEIDAVVAGFAAAADLAALAGLDGVEVDAGVGALLRQFHSGLTNSRTDDYGTDRLRLTRDVLAAVRRAIGPNSVLSLRLSCDELAPWAGVTPHAAAEQAVELSDVLDLLVVVRGGPYSASAYRPDSHTPPAFNTELARAIRVAVAGAVPVALQGSVVEVDTAQAALDGGAADLVEMTRAQIADADLVVTLRAGTPERIRPCLLCNQTCRVRDNRNPIVTCVADPRSGHETQDPDPNGQDSVRQVAVVVGGGVAGLEAARVLATRGHRVRVVERSSKLGGALRQAAVGPGRERLALLVDWLEAECRRLGVEIETGRAATAGELDAARAGGSAIVLATGSRPVRDRYGTVGSTEIRDALAVLTAGAGRAARGSGARARSDRRTDRGSRRGMAGRRGSRGSHRHSGPGRGHTALAERRPRRRQRPIAAAGCHPTPVQPGAIGR